MNEVSSTGINQFENNKPREAIIFLDNTCPKCTGEMVIDSRFLKSSQLKIRYICRECGFICPIRYDGENMDQMRPLYDNSINEFLSNFGEDIHERIMKLVR